ncbi:hypothetical protein GGR92_001899 [Spirosoma lacussanchae]
MIQFMAGFFRFGGSGIGPAPATAHFCNNPNNIYP